MKRVRLQWIVSGFAALSLLWATGSVPMPSAAVAQAPQKASGEKYFLKVDGVEGEIQEAGHTGEIAVAEYGWNQPRPLDTSAKVVPASFKISMPMDKAMPALLRKASVREKIGKMTLTVRNTWGMDYMKWILTDSYISNFATDGAAGDPRPTFTIELSVGKVDVEYREQYQNGGMGPAAKATWQLR